MTRDVKKGTHTVGVQRQSTGTAGLVHKELSELTCGTVASGRL
jgi:SRSO17 transposase